MITERLAFSYWQADDSYLAWQLWGDPQVTRLICSSGLFSSAEITERLATERANQDAYHVEYWPIFSLQEEELVGCCGLRPFDAGNGIFEYGVHVRPVFWGQGLALEAGRAVLLHAAALSFIKEICAGHHPENIASKKLLQKLGFEYQFDSYYAPTGLMHPSYRYVMKKI